MSKRNAKHDIAPSYAMGRRGGGWIPALLRTLGTLVLAAVILICAPLTVPRLMGYEIYDVLTASMAPEIPAGSAVYVKALDPVELEEGEVAAFLREGRTVVHRVVENRRFAGRLITRGDANPADDGEPVPYEAVVGRVERHVPLLGHLMAVLSGAVGKLYMLCLALCGVLFHVLAARIRSVRELSREAE